MDGPLIIKGTEGMVVHYADCCHPIPGDAIVGILDVGKGILVHIDTCRRIARIRRHRDRFLPLRWAEHAIGEFLVSISVEVINERGVLALLAQSISQSHGNIEDIHVGAKDGQCYAIAFDLQVKGRVHLAHIIRMLRKLSVVTKVRRM